MAIEEERNICYFFSSQSVISFENVTLRATDVVRMKENVARSIYVSLCEEQPIGFRREELVE